MPSTNTQVGYQRYGKSCVRVLKVNKRPERHEVVELSVETLLEGNFDNAYLSGDNSMIVPTDTVKNTIYILSREHKCTPIEEFALLIAKHFLEQYNHVSGVQIKIDQVNWDRLLVNGEGHHHTFTRSSPYTRFTKVYATRNSVEIKSGLKDLVVMKTTKSGFTNYLKDKFTTLPEAKDRCMKTNIYSEWTYNQDHLTRAHRWIVDATVPVFNNSQSTTQDYVISNYSKTFDVVKQILLNVLAGEPKQGVYSESVQETLFQMGTVALNTVTDMENIFISLPNLHCVLFDMTKFNMANDNEVFQPQDEPRGLIEAYVSRKGANKGGLRLSAPSRL